MKKIAQYFFIALIVYFLFSCFANAQNSLISEMLKIRESIVDITAFQTQFLPSSPTALGIDTTTQQMIIAENIKKSTYAQKSAGVIISPDGFIITNLHAIYGTQNIFVKLLDGTSFTAQIISISTDQDLALVKINASKHLSFVELEDPNNIQLGAEVVHIGSSDILNNTISSGKIISLGTTTINNKREIELIKINMNMYNGDSGGPILSRDGKLIGIMMGKFEKQDRSALAVPSNKIKKLYLEFLKNRYNTPK